MKINGSLVFDASAASEIQNLRIQKVAANPTFGASDVGRLIYNTATRIIYVGVGAPVNNWVAIATGGDASALQAELDATQASLGTVINSNGTYNSAALTEAVFGSHTSLTQALNNLAAAVTTNDALAQLSDVSLSSPASGQYLRYNGTVWQNDTFTLSDVSDVTVPVAELNLLTGLTANAADLNKLDLYTGTTGDLNRFSGFDAGLSGLGVTITFTEYSYLDGLTGNIQGQLDNLQAEDATLTAVAALNGTGIVVQTAGDPTPSFTHRSLVAPAAGFTITNANAVGGNPTFVLANGLASIEALATTGFVVQTAADTFVTRDIVTASAGRITVTNGDGVAASPTLDLATVTATSGGTFQKLTTDAYGRVTALSNVAASDITTLVDSVYINVAGDTMAGVLNMGNNVIAGVADPVAGTDAANKNYVDAYVSGLSWKQAVRVATTTNVDLTTQLEAGDSIDGVTLVAGDRVLVKNQTNAALNGIYVVQATGAAVRATDMDAPADFDSATVFVREGTANADTGWTQTSEVVTVGTTSVTFQQFTGAGAYVAGVGLGLTGNTFFVNLGSGIFEGPSDAVGLDLYQPTTSALILTTDGTTRENPLSLDGKLHLLLNPAGALAQDASGLRINAASVTNAMLVNNTITLDADDTGSFTVALGGTLSILGTTAQGISTAIVGSTVQVTALDATSSQKGVASFNSSHFSVSGGAVSLATAGIGNSLLTNSTITFSGTTGNDPVALGETFTFNAGTTHAGGNAVQSTVGSNAVTLSLRLADATNPGVASFDAAHFSVAAGAVSLAATLDDLTNVSGADAAATDDLLSKSAGDWSPVSRASVVASTSVADHNDVTVTSPNNGETLIRSGGQWVNRKVYHLHTQASAATTWTVTHGLNQKYCNVTIVDDTDEVVIPQSITFTSATALTVTFNTAVAGYVVVMGVNVA